MMKARLPKRRAFWRRGEPNCREVGAALQAFLDREVDERFHDLIEAHLRACERCGLEAETHRQICAALSRQSGAVPAEAIDRLRTFGRQLQHDDLGPP